MVTPGFCIHKTMLHQHCHIYASRLERTDSVKVYISADIEGVTGVTDWDETTLDKTGNQVAVEQMTAEVVAACEGAIHAGANVIWVKDAHDMARNLLADRLPEQARLVRGWSGHPYSMMQELDGTFDAALMIGYHSPAGGGGNPLAHTMNGGIVEIRLNGRPASEFLVNAYTASLVEVPVVFLSGDAGICAEARAAIPNIGTVAVKEGIGGSTVSIHPRMATERIREGVFGALSGDRTACYFALPGHFDVEIRYRLASKAYGVSFYPGACMKDSTTLQFQTDDYFEVLRLFQFVL